MLKENVEKCTEFELKAHCLNSVKEALLRPRRMLRNVRTLA
jgi:hypothetical protein